MGQIQKRPALPTGPLPQGIAPEPRVQQIRPALQNTAAAEAATSASRHDEATEVRLGPAAPTLPFVSDEPDDPTGPNLADIKKGEILAPGQRSQAVIALRALLNETGYPVPVKGENMDLMDAQVAEALGRFQLAEKLVGPDSPHKGLLGPTTLTRLQKEADEEDYDKEVGKRIASAAVKAKLHDRTSGHMCYAHAANYIERGVKANFLSGGHAYMAANQLAKSPYFKEETIDRADLGKLPDGAVIVYPAQGGHDSGHIDVVATHPKTGARLAISDFTRSLEPSPWRDVGDARVKYRVFIPVGDK